MISLPGYDVWKTRLPDYWDWDDGEEDALLEEEYLFSLETQAMPPLYSDWEQLPYGGEDVLPDDDLLEHMGWEL